MKNNLCYEVETTNKVAYIIFSIFMLIVLFIYFIQGGFEVQKEELYFGLGALFGFAAFVYLVLYLSDRSKIKIKKEYENIKNIGRKLDGKIIKPNEYRVRSGDSYTTNYTVTVEYKNPKDDTMVTYETPELAFNPYDVLGSKTCSIYILEDKIYVTDFIEKAEGVDSVWKQEAQAKDPEGYKEIEELRKKEMKKVTRWVIIFILFWLAIVYFGFISKI